MNIHAHYFDTPYGDVGKIVEALDYLGIKRVRDTFVPWGRDRYLALAKAGVRFNVFLGREKPIPDFLALVKDVQAQVPGSVVSLEGGNESNFWPLTFNGRTDLNASVEAQAALYQAVKADPALKALPVANLTLGAWGADGHRLLGDMRDRCDFANVHIYFGGGGPPVSAFGYALGLGQIPAAGKPSVITETGYPTSHADGQLGVDETTQAKQSLSLVMRAALNGIRQTYFYELVDQKPDPERLDRERNFGLFRMDWSAKPAASALRALTGLLGGPGAASGGSLAYQVENLPAGGQHVLFRTPDEGYAVAIWAEPDIWDEVGRKPLPAPASDVVVRLTWPTAFETFDPLIGASPLTAGYGQAITVRVSDHPVIVKLKP